MSEDDAAAAAQELEALQAIYGDDAGDAPVRLEIASPSEWRFRLGADAILEVFVPRDYPSLQAPTPVLHAPRLGDRASALVDQLLELYEGAEARHMHTNGLTLKHSTALSYVSWVLSHLLSDRKIAAASHNMVAYSFVDASSGVRVFDNDDDGEGGSGAKLASTIDNKGARDVIVVVSRWFGGVHLGPARFKHIASVAGALLEEQGYCRGRTGGASRGNKKGA
ncbi:hypothetical protein EMIHUDRAFT_203080 [Emiliania huxleyi CCMP1516]|uniref:Impact N-terminal domain-containing protein n=2 Tax=Emiliania huxleyi TaxID=2903 RepID=A0A0D3K5H6_EMIH1|nr:hypothetical protein EMIHUDRAFT_203080 [Emiliania huxleyi CCMP1516]EOD31011.1 hypothetical protein EMIHUDRAFT_203080 [Emiliania huxleyi CCMP1516]|eukprot:XP_005783440.1 hypothetical protein EMIHUDRAFT_203080 [Emiliania huxleyi CCMP1516]